jgi:hypothetical protein
MPRREINPEMNIGTVKKELAERLAAELKSNQVYGQPFIYERKYPTGKINVTVVWDAWHEIPMQERSATIWSAYKIAEGSAYRDQIALANGLTVPEAVEVGMLPFEIIPALRKSDPITEDQVLQAMLEEGATQLGHGSRVHLRFATQDEAEAARQRLITRFPNSEDIWLLNWDVAARE